MPKTSRTAAKVSLAPRRRRPDDRPEEILDAALSEFLEKGFDQARMEDVAARAGISKAGVYLYFRSKDDLLRALIEKEIAPIARNARALAEAGAENPEATLRTVVGGFLSALEDPRVAAAPRLVLSLAGRFPEIAAFYRETVVEHGLAAFRTVHEAGVKKGVFRKENPMVVARAVLGPVLVQLLWTYVLQGEPDGLSARGRAEKQVDFLLEGMLVRKGAGRRR